MQKITINTAGHDSVILVGTEWENLPGYVPIENAVIITDRNLLRLYGSRFPNYPVISIIPGENSKNIGVINDLASQLLDLGLDRKGFIIGIGGGVVCDIAGFLASIYMRGIGFGFVSTSLLSQVDASVGGKNGVNVGHVKNILGNFTQPEFVICDPRMLTTLPEDEYLSGLAELIKAGVILDPELLQTIEQNIISILSRDTLILTELITRAVNIKAEVVRQDEKEKGLRMILNFGHTFGHAIEGQTGLKHGFAVASGMKIAADISASLGLLDNVEKERLTNILREFELLKDYSISNEQLKNYISKDKKKSGDIVNFVLLENMGKAVVRNMTVTDLLDQYMKVTIK